MASARRRLDDILIEQGCFPTRDEVLRAVKAGEVLVEDVRVSSPAIKVKPDCAIRVEQPAPFVSRGGEKLAHGVSCFSVDVNGKHCIDIGSSTGGFTDCLLQAGASRVCCVDVNYGQLAWKIRSDPRVEIHERTNIRSADPVELGAPFDLIVIDVSFIGLSTLARTIAALGGEGTELLALIKPQFESQRGESDRGVIRDEAIRERTIEEVREALEAVGFDVHGVEISPLRGPAGNVEFLLYATLRETDTPGIRETHG